MPLPFVVYMLAGVVEQVGFLSGGVGRRRVPAMSGTVNFGRK
jgi:hypothetical protein